MMDNKSKQMTTLEAFTELNAAVRELMLILLEPLEPLVIEMAEAVRRFESWYQERRPR